MELERLKIHAEERVKFCKSIIQGNLSQQKVDKKLIYSFVDALDIWQEVIEQINFFQTANERGKKIIFKYIRNITKKPFIETIYFMERQKEGISDEWKSKIDADMDNIRLICKDLEIDV